MFYSGHQFLKDLTHVELDMSEDEYNSAILAGTEKSLGRQESQFDGIEIRITETQLHVDDKFFN